MPFKEIPVSASISETKLKRAFKTGLLSLTAAELGGKGASLLLHPESYAKALKAKKAGKGTRLQITHKEVGHAFKHMGGRGMHGGSIWGKIWGGIKKAFKWAKDSGVLSKVADAAVAPLAAYTGQPQLVGAARGGLKQLTGIGMEHEIDGGRLSLADAKRHTKSAYAYLKKKGIITDVVDQAEKFLVSKATKPEHHDMIHGVRAEVKRRYGVGMAGKKQRRAARAAGGSFRLA